MSIQKPMTAKEKAYRKRRDDEWAKKTPAQKKAARKSSIPNPTPKGGKPSKAAIKAAIKYFEKKAGK
mgnify:CR=1 FL=1